MDNISGAWLYPIILIAGALQAWGPPMNGALRNAMTNPWLASIVSFIPVIALLAVLSVCQPRPMPTIEGISNMPWWAPLGGVVGALVIAGLLFVNKVGAGALAGLTITANILMALWCAPALAQPRPRHRRCVDGGRHYVDFKILSAHRSAKQAGSEGEARGSHDWAWSRAASSGWLSAIANFTAKNCVAAFSSDAVGSEARRNGPASRIGRLQICELFNPLNDLLRLIWLP
jgi:transporter family-2 protein